MLHRSDRNLWKVMMTAVFSFNLRALVQDDMVPFNGDVRVVAKNFH